MKDALTQHLPVVMSNVAERQSKLRRSKNGEKPEEVASES
jgi:hypothetical protein